MSAQEPGAALPFSHAYGKLNRSVFPTIRRRDKFGSVGDLVSVTLGERGNRENVGVAEIIGKESERWDALSDRFVTYDTDTENREGATKTINSFYRHPISDDEHLTIYWCKWVSQ